MPKNEMILAVKTAALNYQNLTGNDQSLYLLQIHELLPVIANDLILGHRETLEGDENHRQLLPYIVLTKTVDGVIKYFAYRRGKGVGEARLSGNVSIGVGGHIDLADVQHIDSVLAPMETVIAAVQRELQEEIEFSSTNGGDLDLKLASFGALVDNSNPVGKVHLGLVLQAVLAGESEVQCKEEELETLGWYTATELLDSGLPLENWTKILCLQLAEAEEV